MDDWRVAKSLLTMRSQINAKYPNRDRESDGTIGDQKHAARASEHNPDKDGVVRAMDIDEDLAAGVDARSMVDALIASKDKRILYMIYERRKISSVVSPWSWRAYSGLNPHTHHFHLSVVALPALYDSHVPWAIGDAVAPPAPDPAAPKPAPRRPLLKRGSKGADVELVQTLVGVTVDGDFGRFTEAAVKAFQGAQGLVADGVVGVYTWEALMRPKMAENIPAQRFTNIIATEFGGEGDRQPSAYQDVAPGWAERLGVAVPYRFEGARPLVRAYHGNKTVDAPIVDVGPWNTDDPYWRTLGGRPQAESGIDTRGRTTNRAGIDLTPATADALGFSGKGLVDFELLA